ncbi:hypothetical protein [Sutcliffiella rhizosphaerae]|uniref:DUF58 domain-containing protein n=1 Tax=Sutcliffiella rhizosphaerae TaxID=2880967 RepID=A0ABN8AA59_9BACI|nr:hypothetical protein [Sutcliffiella rhizosphaerae]CAG9622085.1 hypothetical protein BACCIP111883_02876 [Sutcliffiella rhizosphaerae]
MEPNQQGLRKVENGAWMGWYQKVNLARQHHLISGFLFILLAVTFYADSTILSFFFLTIFACLWANYLYLLFVGKKLEISIVESKIKLFNEEQGRLRLRISHHGYLPIFFGKFRVGTDKNIRLQGGEELIHQNQVDVSFQQVGRSVWEVELPFTAVKRGVAAAVVYLEIESFFGWGKVFQQMRNRVNFEVIVYPNSAAVHEIETI